MDPREADIRADIESLERILGGTGPSVDDYRGIKRSSVRHLLSIIDEQRANLAAVPDLTAELLATLKLLWLDAGEMCRWPADYTARVEGVIAKAEGRQ